MVGILYFKPILLISRDNIFELKIVDNIKFKLDNFTTLGIRT